MTSFTARSLLTPALVVLSVVAPTDATAQQGRATPGFSRAAVEGVELEYQVRGVGEPVVLVHAGIFADWFTPLVEALAIAGPYRVVSYHRVGYAGSGRLAGPVSIAQQAAQLRSLMRHLGIERAHVIGHSSGGNIALQLALDAPGMVHSLAMLEPALPVAPSGSERQPATGTSMTQVAERYAAGNKAGAIDGFMRIVAGAAYRPALEQGLPGAFERAVVDADTFFGQELPAVRQWSFTQEDARRITQPVLAVIGEESPRVSPIWSERQRLLLTWLPKAEAFVLPGATHLLHVQNPSAMANGLAAFFARHQIEAR